MAVEYWSQEELEMYYENPQLFIIRANKLRARMVYELLIRLKNSMASALGRPAPH
jgi:hypothetical protein